MGLAGYALYILNGKRDELSGATSYLDHLHVQWLAIAVVAEATSLVAFAALQRRLMAAGHVRYRLRTMTAITLAGNSIQNSIPAGPVFSSVYAYRQFRARGADEVLAGWVLVGTPALLQITLVLLATVGLAGAAGTGSGLDLVTVILELLVLCGLIVAAWSRRVWIARHCTWAVRLLQRVLHRPEGDPATLIEQFVARMNAINPSRLDWAFATSFALANWVFDITCLVLGFLAVGAPVPWRTLLLTYAASQLAANLPITPGGLGVVEGTLIIGLVAFGGPKESTVAAVLLYRILNFWAMLPIGWACWAYTNWTLRRLGAGPGGDNGTEREGVEGVEGALTPGEGAR